LSLTPISKLRRHRSDFFVALLKYASSQYAEACRPASPQQVAAWYQKRVMSASSAQDVASLPSACLACQPSPADKPGLLAGKRVAVLLYSCYFDDPRPRRAAEAMVEAGMEVDVVCLRENDSEPASEVNNGVNVRRSPLRKRRVNKLVYIYQYTAFLAGCAVLLAWRSLKQRYDVVHAHNMPDFLVFAGLVPKLLGARLILDLHDPMPELMMGIYNLNERSLFVRWLKRMEKWSIAFAHLVITPNVAFRELFMARGCPSDKIVIVMNSPRQDIFDPAKYRSVTTSERGVVKPFKMMFHGMTAERQGLHTAIEAVAQLQGMIPGIQFHIFGPRTAYMEAMAQKVRELGLEEFVHYHGDRPQNEIAAALATMDLGIIPNLRNAFTEINMPTRIFENLAMGKPVIAPNTRGIRDYFGTGQMAFFEPGNAKDLSRTILWLHDHPEEARDLVRRGTEVYRQHLWTLERDALLSAVSGLLSEKGLGRSRFTCHRPLATGH
jgi:glycosyltransferase involved in cell wall biosynthesis